jgi:hypothetical protein
MTGRHQPHPRNRSTPNHPTCSNTPTGDLASIDPQDTHSRVRMSAINMPHSWAVPPSWSGRRQQQSSDFDRGCGTRAVANPSAHVLAGCIQGAQHTRLQHPITLQTSHQDACTLCCTSSTTAAVHAAFMTCCCWLTNQKIKCIQTYQEMAQSQHHPHPSFLQCFTIHCCAQLLTKTSSRHCCRSCPWSARAHPAGSRPHCRRFFLLPPPKKDLSVNRATPPRGERARVTASNPWR